MSLEKYGNWQSIKLRWSVMCCVFAMKNATKVSDAQTVRKQNRVETKCLGNAFRGYLNDSGAVYTTNVAPSATITAKHRLSNCLHDLKTKIPIEVKILLSLLLLSYPHYND